MLIHYVSNCLFFLKIQAKLNMNAQVVNVRVKHIRPKYQNLKEWMEDPNNVYIRRGGIVFIDKKRFPPKNSLFANPYKVGRDGTLDEVLKKYREHIISMIDTEEISIEDLENLREKNLRCWCKPKDCMETLS